MANKEISDILDKLGKEVLEAEFRPTKELYIDLVTVKDFRFGLVYSLATEEERKYLVENITKYNIRPNRSFTFGFNKLKDRENQYKRMYTDEKYWDDMFNYAPDTDLSSVLPNFLVSFASKNMQAGYREKMVLNINTYPIEKCINLSVFEVMFTKFLGSKIKVNFFCTKPSEISSDFWTKQQFIVLDDIQITADNKSGIYKPLCDDQSMFSTKVFAPYTCSDEAIDRWEKLDTDYIKKLKDFFTPTEAVLQALCDFKFVPCMIPN